MTKSKEELAKEYSSRFSPENGWGAEISNEAFLAGYDAGQAEVEAVHELNDLWKKTLSDKVKLVDQLKAEIQELKKDKERLDWVIEYRACVAKTNDQWVVVFGEINSIGGYSESPREAIDAAMKEQK